MLVVGLVAFLSLHEGFSGDQALFLIYSKAIGSGAILYRDVWDIKQPAIFVFYLVAGKLFGFTEVGIHLLEIIYWLGFSLLLITGLRKYFTNPLFAVLTPLFTVGIYYSVSGSLHLTQAEGLVCFPMFLCLWFCQKFLENTDRKGFLFLSGFFGGIVLTFKLMFFLILLAFWFSMFVFCFYLLGKNANRILVSAALIFSGLIIPAAIVIIYFALNGALGDLYYTTFIYPLDAVRTITKMENRSSVLINGLEWFLKSYFPVIVLTLLFPVINIKFFFKFWKNKKGFFERQENFLFAGFSIWIFSGLVVILIQKLSWWEYHYSLLMIPLGIVAVKCLERFIEEINASAKIRRKLPAFTLLSVMVAAAFIPTARRLVHKIRQSGKIETIKIGNREVRVTGDAVSDYQSISADTAFLRTENPKPEIFVVSNPLYCYLSDSMPVFASNGAMSDMFTDVEWNRLDREMAGKHPKYIFIETRLIELLAKASPSFINTVRENYSVFSTGERGSFYKLDQ